MSNKLMIDTAEIFVQAGKGGDGKSSFRREKFMPKGGPDGGDGGDGGSVYLRVNPNMSTLRDFRSKPKYEGKPGEPGGQNTMKGANGEDLYIDVPQGTLVYLQQENGEVLIGDLVDSGQALLVATGGKGGKGNDRFKSSVNRTPEQFTKGTLGEAKNIKLEVKLIADVGLVGFPNAGKSTLINKLAGTSAKVANYPFTTLTPNLGVVKLKNGKNAIFADVPGLIAGASEGKGLGDDFLRHIERTRLIVHLIDPFTMVEDTDFAETAIKAYTDIRKELEDYGGALENKKEIVVINKIDIFEIKEVFDSIRDAFKSKDIDVLGISAVTGEGLEELVNEITRVLDSMPEKPKFEVSEPIKVVDINDLPNKRMIFRDRRD